MFVSLKYGPAGPVAWSKVRQIREMRLGSVGMGDETREEKSVTFRRCGNARQVCRSVT